ncbi:MAG: TetR/AcrR family transcriptional regulator [Myxococcota bacterium]|nr:TetR/AcrR family transcriptional regulator [Myxococcota bacterium]
MAFASSPAGPEVAPPDGRQRILDEAAALFLERGYAATSLRHIAAAVGMKAGSLYYHFESKEALLGEILRQGIAVMVEAFEAAEESTRGEPARVRTEAHVRAHLAALFENGPYTAAHVTSFRTAPDSVVAAIVPERDAYEARWTALLAELQRSGELAAETPIGLARLILFGAMNASVEWFDPERGSLDDFASEITRQFWVGVSAR